MINRKLSRFYFGGTILSREFIQLNHLEISPTLTGLKVLESRLMSTFSARKSGTMFSCETSGLLNIIFVSSDNTGLPSIHCSCSQNWINTSSQATYQDIIWSSVEMKNIKFRPLEWNTGWKPGWQEQIWARRGRFLFDCFLYPLGSVGTLRQVENWICWLSTQGVIQRRITGRSKTPIRYLWRAILDIYHNKLQSSRCLNASYVP